MNIHQFDPLAARISEAMIDCYNAGRLHRTIDANEPICCCKGPTAAQRSTCVTRTRARCTVTVRQRALATCVAALVACQETTANMMRMIATRAVLTPAAGVSLYYTWGGGVIK